MNLRSHRNDKDLYISRLYDVRVIREKRNDGINKQACTRSVHIDDLIANQTVIIRQKAYEIIYQHEIFYDPRKSRAHIRPKQKSRIPTACHCGGNKGRARW